MDLLEIHRWSISNSVQPCSLTHHLDASLDRWPDSHLKFLWHTRLHPKMGQHALNNHVPRPDCCLHAVSSSDVCQCLDMVVMHSSECMALLLLRLHTYFSMPLDKVVPSHAQMTEPMLETLISQCMAMTHEVVSMHTLTVCEWIAVRGTYVFHVSKQFHIVPKGCEVDWKCSHPTLPYSSI